MTPVTFAYDADGRITQRKQGDARVHATRTTPQGLNDDDDRSRWRA